MLMRTDKDGLLFVGELNTGHAVPKMDHLVCFLPGAPPHPPPPPPPPLCACFATSLYLRKLANSQMLQGWAHPQLLLLAAKR